MRSLTGQGIPNIEAATPEYPYGKYKNKTSALTNNGTELSDRTDGSGNFLNFAVKRLF